MTPCYPPASPLPRAPSHGAWAGGPQLAAKHRQVPESSLGWVGSWSRSLAGSPKPTSSHFMELLLGCLPRLSVSQCSLETTLPGQPLRGQGASPSPASSLFIGNEQSSHRSPCCPHQGPQSPRASAARTPGDLLTAGLQDSPRVRVCTNTCMCEIACECTGV